MKVQRFDKRVWSIHSSYILHQYSWIQLERFKRNSVSGGWNTAETASWRILSNSGRCGQVCFCLSLRLQAGLGYTRFRGFILHLLSRREVNGKAKHEPNASRKERPQKRGGAGRFEPYGNVNKRYRVFVSNIPYDVKWQALKDLMKDKGKVWMGDQVQLMKKKKRREKQNTGSFCAIPTHWGAL